MKDTAFPLAHRRRNFLRTLTCVIGLKNGKNSFALSSCETSKEIDSQYIIGLIAIRQNDGGTRKSKLGATLLSKDLMSQGTISLKEKGKDIVSECPLDFFAYDPDKDKPGDFAELIIPNGILSSQSKVDFPANSVTADSDLVLIFIFADSPSCDTNEIA